MFESFITREIESILLKFPNKGNIFLKDLLQNDDMPVMYKIFFEQEILNLIFQKNIERKNEKYFDLASEELDQLFSRIDQIYFINSYFTHYDFKETLSNAVKTTFNYLLRPRSTLKWFIFGSDNIKSSLETSRKFNYFSYYPYLINNIKHVLEERDNMNITAKEFEDIVEEVDNNYLYDLTPKEFSLLLHPLFEFFGGDIPIDALVIYLHDKKIYYLSNLFEKEIQNGTKFLKFDIFQEKLFELLKFNIKKHIDSKSVEAEVETGSSEYKLNYQSIDNEECETDEPIEADSVENISGEPDIDISMAPEIKE